MGGIGKELEMESLKELVQMEQIATKTEVAVHDVR